MASPLIANDRPASESSGGDERGVEEEDALLTGQRTGKHDVDGGRREHAKSKWREIGLFVWALLATTAVVVMAVVWQHSRSEAGRGESGGSGKRNLIFMVSDGMGPTSLSLTRTWRQHVEQLPHDQTLLLDDYLIGQSRTRSTSSLVTDSAAGATAFSCGIKSYNGAISVLPDFAPCGSVMEAAKRKGYTTGLVVTTRITDATPAVFASHVRRREMEDSIARQMIGDTHPLGRMVDLMFGGGECHFMPNTSEGSCRHDDANVAKLAKDNGWSYINTKSDFDNLDSHLDFPFMGLFASHDIPYEIDRQHQTDTYPSLEEMTTTALRALSAATKSTDQGFFIMIEGSRIDHAGHANDPAAQVREVVAYDRAMAAVLDFIKTEDTPTLMISTSDHETGGLATARQLHSTYPDYLWYPGVLANASHSASYTAHEYHKHLSAFSHHGEKASQPTEEDTRSYLSALSHQALGIEDCGAEELDALVQDPRLAAYTFADMISRRAQTGWSTHGHSAADVNIYASDARQAKPLVGNRENTDVGAFLRSYLDLDDEVEAVTEELKKHMDVSEEGWLGSIPASDERLDGQDHLDVYAGDHKTRLRRCEVCGL